MNISRKFASGICAAIILGLLVAGILFATWRKSHADEVANGPSTIAKVEEERDDPPIPVDFGPTPIGTVSTSLQKFNYNNRTDRLLTIHSVSIIGNDSGSFRLESRCPKSLGAHASCMIDVFFIPSHTSANSAELVIDRDNAAGKPHTAVLGTLTGTGTDVVTTVLIPCGEKGNSLDAAYIVSREDAVDIFNGSVSHMHSVQEGDIHFEAVGDRKNILVMLYSPTAEGVAEPYLDHVMTDPKVESSLCIKAFQKVAGVERSTASGRDLRVKTVYAITAQGAVRLSSEEVLRIQLALEH